MPEQFTILLPHHYTQNYLSIIPGPVTIKCKINNVALKLPCGRVTGNKKKFGVSLLLHHYKEV